MMDEPADGHIGNENASEFQRLGGRKSESLSPDIVDVVLALLSLTLGLLAIATYGNVHLIALLFITLALWVSIKWFVNELQSLPSQSTSGSETKKSD